MQVRMRTTIVGPGVNAGPGQVVELDDREAHELIAGGYAAAIGEPPIARPQLETAARPNPPETAQAVRPGRRRTP